MSTLATIPIDIHTLPTTPSSPLWELPRKVPRSPGAHSIYLIGTLPPTTALGQSLKDLSSELRGLVQDHQFVQALSSFLDHWKIKSTNSIHPLLFEWFNASQAVADAIMYNHPDLLEVLFEHGFTVDDFAMCMLEKTIQETRDKTMLEMILSRGLWAINEPLVHCGPPILGCFMYDDQITNWLLTLGADLNAPSTDMAETIMHAAVANASLSLFTRLISLNASVADAPGIVARAASAHTPTHNRIPIISYLLDHGANIDEYQGSFLSDDGQNFCALIAWGRQNALHYAVARGSKDLVEFLLKRGADRKIKTWSLITERKWMAAEELAGVCGYGDIKDMLRQSND